MKLKNIMIISSLTFASSPAFSTSYICEACSTGTWNDGTFDSCKSCVDPAVPGVKSCDFKTGKATACNSKYELKNGTCEFIKTSCQAGYGYNSSTNSCSACGLGTYSKGGQLPCSTCSVNNSPGNIFPRDNRANSHWVTGTAPCQWECNSGYTMEMTGNFSDASTWGFYCKKK